MRWTPHRPFARSVVSLLLATTVLTGGSATAAPTQGGDELWITRQDGPRNGNDSAQSLAVSPDGSIVFVTGTSAAPTNSYDFATAAYDAATGHPVWGSRFNGPDNGDDGATAVAASSDGSTVFVTGYSSGSDSMYDYTTLAYDAATGARLWARRYEGPGNGNDWPYALSVSPDGSRVFVTGYSYAGTSETDYATIAYDVATGTELWVSRYNGSGNSDDVAHSVTTSPDGSTVFVTGWSAAPGNSTDFATVAYDAVTGDVLWGKRYKSPGYGDDYAVAIVADPDGSAVFVAGSVPGSGNWYDFATVAYDAVTGAKLWVGRYEGPAGFSDYPFSAAVSPDGSTVFVTGASGGTLYYDYATVAHDAATGRVLWVERYDGPDGLGDIAFSLAASPDSTKVFVTGQSVSTASEEDYGTVAYDAATGATLWVERYDGPDNGKDYVYSVAVSPDSSKVFVTGGSEEQVGSYVYDFATIAYQA